MRAFEWVVVAVAKEEGSAPEEALWEAAAVIAHRVVTAEVGSGAAAMARGKLAAAAPVVAEVARGAETAEAVAARRYNSRPVASMSSLPAGRSVKCKRAERCSC